MDIRPSLGFRLRKLLRISSFAQDTVTPLVGGSSQIPGC